jgi:predicted nucleic acid-binding protein
LRGQRRRQAKAWLESAIGGPETVAFSWDVLLAFLRLTTRGGLFQKPLGILAAFALIDSWLGQPAVTVLHPGARHP